MGMDFCCTGLYGAADLYHSSDDLQPGNQLLQLGYHFLATICGIKKLQNTFYEGSALHEFLFGNIKVYSDFCPVHVAYNICNRFAPKCQTVKGKGIMESFDLRTFDCSDHGLFGTLNIYL